ncbi:uncharacterized protein [Panulirus ornatus]|uniref:uncharacterized protein isoform X6 n=1 Tax=Panulirus ornatus TaxID=150431 RepID=UPI003A893772
MVAMVFNVLREVVSEYKRIQRNLDISKLLGPFHDVCESARDLEHKDSNIVTYNMSSDEKIMEEMGETSHDTPQAITITIMDPSALETTTLDSTLVTSVQTQDTTHGTSTILMVPREGQPSISVEQGEKDILQTVTETHMGTHELPVISNISNPEEETSEQSTIHVTTKTEVNEEGEGEVLDEGEEEDTDDPVGQHCLICNVDMPPEHTEEPVPIFKTQTTTTQRKMAVLLGSLIGMKLTSRKAHSDIMCRRCFGLLDRVDALEVEIRDTKEEIVSKYQETVAAYGGRARRRKPATAKKTDYVFPKVEPDDEDEQVLGLEMDENFEPRVEDLMEEEHDNREDCNAQDEEWEPEFKRPRIKREAADSDQNGPPKRKRGRPRKDASKPKVEARQHGVVSGAQPPAPTRRIVTVPAAFRKCPHCPTIFMDTTQLAQHLAKLHRDHQNERHCQRCSRRFLTYEDNTACDPCLQTLRQNALPSRVSSESSVAIAATIMCGYCHQTFSSRVLAELHCLSTGHSMDDIAVVEPKKEGTEAPVRDWIKVEKEYHMENKDIAAATTSSAGRKTKIGCKTRRGRKRRLMRKNQTTCETCGVECGSVSSLYIHLRANHPGMFPHQCRVCGRRFSIEASAREHERRHAVGELQCPACPLRFSRMSHLHHHACQLHPEFTKFPCQYCGAVKPTVDALHSHIKVHHGDRLGLPAAFSCKVCQETFHTGKALACHRSSRHPGTAVCGFCGAQVGSRYLSKHINAVHTKEKTHKCDKCDKEFYSRTSLTGHQKRQHGPRKHLCDLCGKGYVHNVELQRHLKAHRNQRDFKCDFCNRTFLKAVDLTYHRRSHTGERPHQCKLCPEAFIRPLGLRKHMLKHTTVKKGKRLKYSKKKIDELTSSVMIQAGEEGDHASERASGGAPPAAGVLANTNLPNSPDLTHPLQVFPDTAVVASPLTQPQQRLQPELQQLTSSELPVQQLAVTDLDNSQLEGQLELSQVVEDLSSGELLEMGPGLLLEATDERGADDGVVGSGDGGDGGIRGGEGDASQASQPVQVIYVQFVEEASGWRPDPQL